MKKFQKLLIGFSIIIIFALIAIKEPEGVVQKDNFIIEDVTDSQIRQKVGQSYKIIETYRGGYEGKETAIFRIEVQGNNYLIHFKFKGSTIFSGKEIYKVEKATEISELK